MTNKKPKTKLNEKPSMGSNKYQKMELTSHSSNEDSDNESTDSNMSLDSNTAHQMEADSTPKLKIPPIMDKRTDWLKVAGKLTAAAPSDTFLAKAIGEDTIKIQCVDALVIRIVQKYLTVTKTDFHTFSLPEEKSLKIVIKGLLTKITEQQVSEEITNQGFEVVNVRQFGKPDKRLPIHMVSLKNTPKNKGIFNMTHFYSWQSQLRNTNQTPQRSATTAKDLATRVFTVGSRHDASNARDRTDPTNARKHLRKSLNAQIAMAIIPLTTRNAQQQ